MMIVRVERKGDDVGKRETELKGKGKSERWRERERGEERMRIVMREKRI